MKNFNDFISGVAEAALEEGNAFLAARQKAIDEEKDKFEFDGKTYKVQEEEESGSETHENEPKSSSYVIRKFSEFVSEEDAVADNLEGDADDLAKDIKDDAKKDVEDAEASKDAKEKESEIEDTEVDADDVADADDADDKTLKSDADDADEE